MAKRRQKWHILICSGVHGGYICIRKQAGGTSCEATFHLCAASDTMCLETVCYSRLLPVRRTCLRTFQYTRPDTRFYIYNIWQNILLDMLIRHWQSIKFTFKLKCSCVPRVFGENAARNHIFVIPYPSKRPFRCCSTSSVGGALADNTAAFTRLLNMFVIFRNLLFFVLYLATSPNLICFCFYSFFSLESSI